MDISKLKGNSTTEDRRELPEKRAAVISGGATKSTGKKERGRIAELLDLGEHDTVKDYVIQDIIIPSFKDVLYEIINGAAEMYLFSGTKRPSKVGKIGGGPTPYSTIFGNKNTKNKHRERDNDENKKERMSYSDVTYESKEKATKVYFKLVDALEEYDQITVADLYEYSGLDSEWTDWNWGWTSLNGVGVSRLRGGRYMIDLPKPRPLNKD